MSIRLLALPIALAPSVMLAQRGDSTAAQRRAAECPSCAGWNAPQVPFNIVGNTWYVGTRGLSAILVTSPAGHVLLDGGLPESAPAIAANIRQLGFRVEDVRLIVNSHAHYDHAGGIAELQRMSGAEVAALAWSAGAMQLGNALLDDPQHAIHLAYPAVARVRTIAAGDTLRVGPIALVAHATGGHTPGGTTWSWRSCSADAATGCVEVVYADSQTPVSADGYRFTDHPELVSAFGRGFAEFESMKCEVLLTPHPSASRLFERAADKAEPLVDAGACRRYAAGARERLQQRLAAEKR